ncbi:hypothetical protein JYK21_03825 [Ralstonia pickettii]|nr:hypothetical protein [Ralstonia pickettii]
MEKPKGMTYSKNAIYAVYKGDDFLVMGTQKECADALNVNPEFIHWMTTPTGKRRFESRVDKSKALTALVVDWESEEASGTLDF